MLGLIDGHTINIPHKGAESEVSTVPESLGLAGSQVNSVKGNIVICGRDRMWSKL